MPDPKAKIESFVAGLKAGFPAQPTGEFAGRGNTEKRRLRTVLRECGASRYSGAVLQLLSEELTKQKVFSNRNVLDQTLRRDRSEQLSCLEERTAS